MFLDCGKVEHHGGRVGGEKLFTHGSQEVERSIGRGQGKRQLQ
jgi:hypothetical protein